ncbi:hypothetical protein LSH36_143g00008, partial [Paralvinella palmiformis]
MLHSLALEWSHLGHVVEFRHSVPLEKADEQTSSGEVSAAGSPSGTPIANQVPKYGTLIPNRIFVGGIAAN